MAAAGAKVRLGNELWTGPRLTVSRPCNHPLNQRGKDVFAVSGTVIGGTLGNAGPRQGTPFVLRAELYLGLADDGQGGPGRRGPGGELRFLTRASEAPRGREHGKAREGLTRCTAREVAKREVVRNVGTIRDPGRKAPGAPGGG